VTYAAEQVGLSRIPVALRWDGGPVSSYTADDDALRIDAGAGTDLFIDPERTAEALNAPNLLARATGDVLLCARVRVAFTQPADAAGLLVWLNDRAWAKLGLELSVQGEPEVVSVVTRGTSDRCSGFSVEGDQVWLRVARVGTAYAFHASVDGTYWRLIRHFALYGSGSPSYGFAAQSPSGPGCTATFDEISFHPRRLGQLRDGS
jgi:regulation of enolase protein 1 (concanavalin A-like superfamily)